MQRRAQVLLLLAVAALLLVAAVLWSSRPPLPVTPNLLPADSTMQTEQFRYTELQNGVALYRLAGHRMHDEPGHLGDVRIAVMRMVKIDGVQLELLQPKVAGWLLEADHGQLLSGSHRLSLWGNVHGERKQGGRLRAGRIEVDPRSGVVKLQDGYVLDAGNRHERGVATLLGR